MNQFTREETNLMCIYHTGTRADLITELSEMKKHLEQDETELLELVQSVVDKLSVMSDGEFGIIIEELVANFE
ncbi:MAG: transposon-transfer assisting family protein [Tissierellales bacterium]|nr:transposon-transfer assisting family protein [Tissierellales bacterium]